MTCECNNVTNYEGQHKCILCGKEFHPVEDAGEQIPAKEHAFREGIKDAGSWTIDKWMEFEFSDEPFKALSGTYKPDR